jgi:hypothetical protein
MAKVVSSIPGVSAGTKTGSVVTTPSKDGGCLVIDLWCKGQDEACWGFDGGCGKPQPVSL